MNLIILAQQTGPAVMPPRDEALLVLAVVVSSLVVFAVALWRLSYHTPEVRISIKAEPPRAAKVLEYPRRRLDTMDEAWERLQLEGLYLAPGDRREAL